MIMSVLLACIIFGAGYLVWSYAYKLITGHYDGCNGSEELEPEYGAEEEDENGI